MKVRAWTSKGAMTPVAPVHRPESSLTAVFAGHSLTRESAGRFMAGNAAYPGLVYERGDYIYCYCPLPTLNFELKKIGYQAVKLSKRSPRKARAK